MGVILFWGPFLWVLSFLVVYSTRRHLSDSLVARMGCPPRGMSLIRGFSDAVASDALLTLFVWMDSGRRGYPAVW